MKLEIRDIRDEVITEVEFEQDPGSERRITTSSSTGSSTHTFYEQTPVIVVRVPGMESGAAGGDDAPVRNVRTINEVVGPLSRPIEAEAIAQAKAEAEKGTTEAAPAETVEEYSPSHPEGDTSLEHEQLTAGETQSATDSSDTTVTEPAQNPDNPEVKINV